jgi:hypothetical protein
LPKAEAEAEKEEEEEAKVKSKAVATYHTTPRSFGWIAHKKG